MRFCLPALFCILCCNQLNAQQNNIPADWALYTDTAYHFSVRYPSDWEFKLKNINCIVRVMDDKAFTIKMAEDAIKKSLSEKLQDYQLLRTEYLTWNNSETLEIEYTCTQSANDITYSIHMLQRMGVVKGTLFTLTYTAEQKSFSKYIDTVKKVLQSLKVK